MNGDVTVQEKKRVIEFASGRRTTLNNVTMFNAKGTFLRLQSDEGYSLHNIANIDSIFVDGERVR